jgi:hypothetical protein
VKFSTELEPAAAERPIGADGWIAAHTSAIAVAVIGAGFLLRLAMASLTFLVPDEAVFAGLVHQHDFHTVLRAAVFVPHPPLMLAILYWVQSISRSEVALRMPSVLVGPAALWFTSGGSGRC